MNILIYENKTIGIEDLEDGLKKLSHSYKCISTTHFPDRVCSEFEMEFDNEIEKNHYDCVFTFNYSPIISNCCNKHNMPYIAFVYDSPQVALYSCTVINPCNHIFIFDSAVYLDLKNMGIPTVEYMPLAVNVDRLDKMLSKLPQDNCNTINCTTHDKFATSPLFNKNIFETPTTSDILKTDNQTQNQILNFTTSDISFVGTMYNEKHNFYERLDKISDYTRGYLDSIMASQLKVYGYNFIEELLTPEIIDDMYKSLPMEPNKYGVETKQWLFANYVLARKMANIERTQILKNVSEQYETKLYTPFKTPELPNVKNMGSIDYYDFMPYVFKNSKINLNISLRSIKNGIPLRCLDIMGAGGLLMSNYQADFYNHFIPGEDLLLYESQDDLMQKCDYYLHHENERKQIIANGYGKIKEFHTYEIRLNEIFEKVF